MKNQASRRNGATPSDAKPPAGSGYRVECLADRADLVHLDQHRVHEIRRIASSMRSGLVTRRSSPTICTRSPRRSVRSASRPSRLRRGRLRLTRSDSGPPCPVALDELVAGQRLTCDVYVAPAVLNSEAAGSSTIATPPGPARTRRRRSRRREASTLLRASRARAQSRPRRRGRCSCRRRAAWRATPCRSRPARSASRNDGAPSGATMNSWKSSAFCACAPPLITLKCGTGSRCTPTSDGEPPMQRHSFRGGHGPRRRHRDPRGGVGAQAALVGCAIEADERLVERGQRFDTLPDQRVADLAFDLHDRALNTCSAVTGDIAVTKLDRLAAASRRPRRHTRDSDRTIVKGHRDFDGGATPRIEDLAGA